MKLNRNKQPIRAFIVAALILLIGLGGWAAHWSGKHTDAAMRERLLQQAIRIAQALDPDLVKSLTFTKADRDNPAFERIREQMTAYGRTFWQRGIYSMALHDGIIHFGPENYAENDPMSSPPGTIYEKPNPDCFEAFRTGKPLTFGPQTDEYGTFVSALAPVLDPRDGAVLMVVGLDIQADDWQARINAARQRPALSALALSAILLMGYAAIRRRDRLVAEKRERFKHLETIWVGVWGLALTVAVTVPALEAERREQQRIIEQKAVVQAGAVDAVLHTVRNHIATLVHSHEDDARFDHPKFAAVAASMVGIAPVQAYAWIPAVPADQKNAVEVAARRAGNDNFVFWERNARGETVPVANRAEYYPVYSVEPPMGNQALLGFDMGSNTQWRAALEQSVRTGRMTIINATGSSYDSIHSFIQPYELLIAQPVFMNGAPNQDRKDGDASERRLRGFILSILRPQAILDGALRSYTYEGLLVAADLLDLRPVSDSVLLASHPLKSLDDQALIPLSTFQQALPLFTFDRAWAMVFYPSTAFYTAYPLWIGWLVGATGLMMTATFAAFTGFLRERRTAFRRLLRERTTALRSSEEKYRNIYENMQDTYIETTMEGIILEMNSQIEKLTGGQYRKEELIGRNAGDFFADTEGKEKLLAALKKDGSVEDWEVTYNNRDGFPISCAISAKIHYDAKKQRKKVICVLRDVAERKRVEKRLQVLSKAVEQSPVSIVITDPAGVIEYVNPKFMEITGYTLEEALGQNPRVLNSGKQPKDFYKSLWETITSGHDWRGELCNKKRTVTFIGKGLRSLPSAMLMDGFFIL